MNLEIYKEICMQKLFIKNAQSGFTVFELMLSLIVFMIITLFAYKTISTINEKKVKDQVSDQSKAYTKMATQYLTDNYRSLITQTKVAEVILPFGSISQYIPSSANRLTSYYQAPCLYITSTNAETINAYLIFANSDVKAKHLSRIEAGEIARAIGGNAGVLVDSGNGKYTVYAATVDGLSISSSAQSKMQQICGFVALANNSLIINLSQDQSFFSSITGSIDQAATAKDTDPSLKKNGGLVTMQTNLYLDNVIKESSSYQRSYCDAAKLLVSDANNVCANFANSNNWSTYLGTASWISSVLSANQLTCNATANAHFYSTTTNYSCVSVAFPPADNYCPYTISGKTKVANSAIWSPLPGTLSGSQCLSTASAKYQLVGSCPTVTCTEGWAGSMQCNNTFATNNDCYKASTDLNIFSLDKYQKTCVGGFPPVCSQKYTGSYNQAANSCTYKIHCINGKNGIEADINANVNNYTGSIDSYFTSCAQVSQNAISSQITSDLGFRNCGANVNFPVLNSTIGVPAEHVYRAIDYGQSNINGERIQLRTSAAAGAAPTSSQLSVVNAGLQAGYIAPKSNPVAIGTSCTGTELGKMTQQLNAEIMVVGGQLQCMYNPTYCFGTGYCYLPIRNSSFIYNFTTLKSSYSCSTGTIVDDNQPTRGINASVSCTNLSGWTITQGVHGVKTNCYDGVAGFSFCTGYKTVCSYRNSSGATQDLQINALVQLKCGVTNNTFTVDNYTQ